MGYAVVDIIAHGSYYQRTTKLPEVDKQTTSSDDYSIRNPCNMNFFLNVHIFSNARRYYRIGTSLM